MNPVPAEWARTDSDWRQVFENTHSNKVSLRKSAVIRAWSLLEVALRTKWEADHPAVPFQGRARAAVRECFSPDRRSATQGSNIHLAYSVRNAVAHDNFQVEPGVAMACALICANAWSELRETTLGIPTVSDLSSAGQLGAVVVSPVRPTHRGASPIEGVGEVEPIANFGEVRSTAAYAALAAEWRSYGQSRGLDTPPKGFPLVSKVRLHDYSPPSPSDDVQTLRSWIDRLPHGSIGDALRADIVSGALPTVEGVLWLRKRYALFVKVHLLPPLGLAWTLLAGLVFAIFYLPNYRSYSYNESWPFADTAAMPFTDPLLIILCTLAVLSLGVSVVVLGARYAEDYL